MSTSTQPPGPTLGNVAKAAAETAPPAGLVGWHYLLDLPIEKWLTVLVILYTVLQIVVLVRKEFMRRGRNRGAEGNRENPADTQPVER